MNNGPEHTKRAEGSGEDGREQELLEQALRQALRHEAPPVGFADRVMARATALDPSAASVSLAPTAAAGPGATKTSGKILRWPVRTLWMRAAVAAALLLGIFEGETTYKRIREQQRRIAAATAQFQTSERVTVRALAQAREQLQRAGVPLNFD